MTTRAPALLKNQAKMFNLKGCAQYGRSIPWPEGWGWVCYWGGGGWSCLLSQDRPEQPGSECSLAVPPVAPERKRRAVGLAGSHSTTFLSIVKMYFSGSLKGKGIYLEIMIFTNFGGHKYAVVQCTIHKQQEYYKSYIWVRFKQITGQQLNLFNRSPATYINTEADIAPDRDGHLKRI